FDQPLGETFRLGLAVASLDTDEDQEAAPDARDDLAVNGHGCTADALQQAYHRTLPERGISCLVCHEQAETARAKRILLHIPLTLATIVSKFSHFSSYRRNVARIGAPFARNRQKVGTHR